MTLKEWWELVEEEWYAVESLIQRFHPSGEGPEPKGPRAPYFFKGTEREEFPITAPAAEAACEGVRKMIDRPAPVEKARKAREEKDHRTLHSILNETWFGLPESVVVHSLDGFDALCDLCGEYEGEGEAAHG